MKTAVILFLTVLLISCSGSRTSDNKLLLNADLVRIDSWVNLMPGSRPTFHINGILRITNNEKFDLDTLKTKLNVLQGDSLIYSISPDFDPLTDGNSFIRKNEEKEFTFSVGTGLSLKRELDYNKPVLFEFVFSSKGKEHSFKSDSVKIEKAY